MLVRVFLESGAFPLGLGGPFRTGRVASSAELHGPREPAARLPALFEVLKGLKEEPNDAGMRQGLHGLHDPPPGDIENER